MPSPSQRRATVITSLNRKGGVGKTHLCWLMASMCQEQGKKCLVIDLDPQANFSSSFFCDGDGPTVEQLFSPAAEPDLAPLIRKTPYDCIDVVASSARLEPFNVPDARTWQKSDLQFSLREAIAPILSQYDYILCDCPPSLSLVSYAALCATDFIIIPLEAARWGALGTQHVIAAIEHVRKSYNSQLQLLGYVVSRYKKRRSYHQAYLDELRKTFGDDAFETLIPDLATFEQSVTDRVPLTLHSPHSYASDIARQFFAEVESRCHRLAGGGDQIRGGRLSKRAEAAGERQPAVAVA